MTTQTRITNGLTATVALLTLAIGAGAFTLSYDALYETGARYGVPLAKAWIWPLLIDAPLIVFTLALLVSQILRQSARLWAGLVILYTLATVAFNLSHAQPTPLGWLVAIVAPVGLLLTTEALRHLAKTIIERQAVVDSLAELSEQADQARAHLAQLLSQTESAAHKLESIKSDIKAEQMRQKSMSIAELNAAKFAKIEQRREQVLSLLAQGLKPGDIAGELNVSLATVKRDVAKLNGKAAEVRR